MMDQKEAFLKQFDGHRRQLSYSGRGAGSDPQRIWTFQRSRDEKWKYTRVNSIIDGAFKRNDAQAIDDREFQNGPMHGATSYLRTDSSMHESSDTRFQREYTWFLSPPWSGEKKASVLSKLGGLINHKKDAFPSLNTAYFLDGAYLEVEKNATKVEQPIVILNITSGESPSYERAQPDTRQERGRSEVCSSI